MMSVSTFRLPPFFSIKSEVKYRSQVRVQSLGSDDSEERKTISSSDSVIADGVSLVKEKKRNKVLIDRGSGGEKLKNVSQVDGGNQKLKPVSKELGLLWDDGYGTKTVKDYLEQAKEMVKPDAGPPRWFCPIECGEPLKDSPVLLFLPGVDGVGLGLISHHKALGKIFEVRCLHIPVYNRTPFQELVKFVEQTVRLEHASSPNKPIYLVGDCFGGCLALSVAARNPKIDLELILVNPATSFGRSQLQPLLPVLESLPRELHNIIPYLFSIVISNPIKMAMVDIELKLPPRIKMEQVYANLTSLLPCLSTVADLIPKDTLLWKLRLLKSAADYANSRLHAVKAAVLILASGVDNMLPSIDECQRLRDILPNCKARHFKQNGHTLLMEEGVNLLTIIKGTNKYRRSRTHDYISDYVPPSLSEFNYGVDKNSRLLLFASSAATYSTLDDGKIVRGLAGIPNEGPVILVGYHNLKGLEDYSLGAEMLREKKILLRGLVHPAVFSETLEQSATEFSDYDWLKVMGGVPVTPSNMFRLLAEKEHVILYPGGVREALHRKGEEYKLFWPKQADFVRMAARFGATIVPFGAVGEDDLVNMVLDYNDAMRIRVMKEKIIEASTAIELRDGIQGEAANQALFMPIVLPKLPGRFYFLFGKPIQTKGRQEFLNDRENASQMYLHIKSEVEHCLAYLLKKREEDPYRNLVDRVVYCALHHPVKQIPSFPP